MKRKYFDFINLKPFPIMITLIKKMKLGIAVTMVLAIFCSMTIPNECGKRISIGEFKAHGSLVAVLQDFDFDAKCVIVSFTLTRVAKQEDPASIENTGGAFRSTTQTLVNQANHGDVYYFDDIKARCPGDVAGRKIASLVFTIK
jgi:hypothetical protein